MCIVMVHGQWKTSWAAWPSGTQFHHYFHANLILGQPQLLPHIDCNDAQFLLQGSGSGLCVWLPSDDNGCLWLLLWFQCSEGVPVSGRSWLRGIWKCEPQLEPHSCLQTNTNTTCSLWFGWGTSLNVYIWSQYTTVANFNSVATVLCTAGDRYY